MTTEIATCMLISSCCASLGLWFSAHVVYSKPFILAIGGPLCRSLGRRSTDAALTLIAQSLQKMAASLRASWRQPPAMHCCFGTLP